MEIVGSNIRRFRKERNYSLREFAEKVGASASFISQVEMGKVKPSLSKLKEIADGLNTTVGLLIGESVRKDHSRIVRKGERKHTDHLGSGINVHLLSNVDPFKQMQPLLMELDRGASSGDNQYQHYGQEFVLILKGKMELSLGEEKTILNEGDSMYFNSHIPHSFRNIHTSKTVVIWVATPPSF